MYPPQDKDEKLVEDIMAISCVAYFIRETRNYSFYFEGKCVIAPEIYFSYITLNT